MIEPMFDVELYRQRREQQQCDLCPASAWTSNDELRVRGWIVFDGRSETGKNLHVRICPKCQKEKS